MLKDRWKHDAANKLAVIRSHLYLLHKDSLGNIKEDNAIDVRDLCQDMMCAIDIFGKQHFKSFDN